MNVRVGEASMLVENKLAVSVNIEHTHDEMEVVEAEKE